MKTLITLIFTLPPWLLPFMVDAAQPLKPMPTKFECRWAHGKITIDGKVNEKVWQDAQQIDTFYLPWLGDKARRARTATKAKLLWDRTHIYFFADMEDSDIYADIKEHDGKTWFNDVFELFFRPDDTKPAYYEFQVNALNTRMDLFLPRRGAGGYPRFKSEVKFDFTSAVQRNGTLNRWRDKDKGWSVEGKIAWKSFQSTGGRPKVNATWKFALCRYDYSVAFEGPELSTCAPLKSKRFADFHLFEDYATLKFIGPAQTKSPLNKTAQGLRQPWTTSRVVGSPEPPKPYRVARVYPKLKLDWPICIRRIPDSDRLLVINERGSYAPAKLLLLHDTAGVTKYEILKKFVGVAYDLTFHPRFRQNGYIYIGSHEPKHKDGPHCRITRYTLQTKPPYYIVPNSAKTIIEWPSNGHNGAAVVFGKDGMLYVTTGDGTVRRDTDQVGQRLDVLRAKVLRLDVDHPQVGRAYAIPKDNPFVDYPKARPETWCYGLRNPWRIAVDAKTGHLWVGNNGQDTWEQIYLIRRGANYGWSVYEGSHLFITERERGPTPIHPPTFEHHHAEARSLTGGIVYHGRKYPDLQSAYLYGDYSTGKIWAAKHDGQKVQWHKEIADTTLAITCFEVNKDGDILISDHRGGGKGGFYRLEKRPRNDTKSKFPRTLNETGLFQSVAKHRVAPGVLAYSVNVPGWHDGATVQRFLALPANTNIDFRNRRGWNFPDGTVAMQTLSLPRKTGGARRVETRLLTKQQGEWAGYSYLWNDQQTEAMLVEARGIRKRFPQTTRTWRIPSRAECLSCHSRAANYVLGLTTLQMNGQHDYGSFRANQMEMFEEQGLFGAAALLKKSPPELDRLPQPWIKTTPLEKRARAYLHANCAHCHVLDGGGNARIVVDWDTARDKMNLLNIAPMHGDFGIRAGKLVVPGEPHKSILAYRLASLGGGRMPRLGSHHVDENGVRLIRQWIEQLGPQRPKTNALLTHLKAAKPAERKTKINQLLSSTQDGMRLLFAIDDSKQPSPITAEVIAQAATAPPAVRDLFERFLPDEKRPRRLGTTIRPEMLLALKGDSTRGRQLVFRSQTLTCINCHRIHGKGKDLGPDLSHIGKKYTQAKILENILTPSKEIDKKYATFLVITKEGRVHTGILLNRDNREVQLKDNQHNTIRIPVREITSMIQQQTSMMPDMLLKDLTAQQAADVLAFLASLQ